MRQLTASETAAAMAADNFINKVWPIIDDWTKLETLAKEFLTSLGQFTLAHEVELYRDWNNVLHQAWLVWKDMADRAHKPKVYAIAFSYDQVTANETLFNLFGGSI